MFSAQILAEHGLADELQYLEAALLGQGPEILRSKGVAVDPILIEVSPPLQQLRDLVQFPGVRHRPGDVVEAVHARHQEAPRLEHPHQLPECLPNVGAVFEYALGQDEVEMPIGEIHPVDVALDERDPPFKPSLLDLPPGDVLH